MFKAYYLLTKPGIIYSNALAAAAGFFLASKTHVNFFLFITLLLGIGCVIASACIFNNYRDRDIDQKMQRTKNRALVTKTIPVKNALVFASILGIIGVGILLLFTNFLTVAVGLVGFIDYVFWYTSAKRTSTLSTLIGSISGATPPVAGYTAVTNRLDLGAFLLFLILVFWQMPHFYAIALYRLKDYKTARIPVLPAVKGIQVTKIHMLLYILGFLGVASLFALTHYTGYVFLIVVGLIGLVWFVLAAKGFWVKESVKWARKMFFFSLIVILVVCVMLSVNVLLF